MQSLLEWLPYLALVATVGCVGVLGVTVARNVPLNNTLAATPAADAATRWPAYVAAWGRWNYVRTGAALAATAAFAIGLLDWGARFG